MTAKQRTSEEPVVSPRASVFSLAGLPRLSEGHYSNTLANAEDWSVRVQVFASIDGVRGSTESNQNETIHKHPDEDHLFLIMAGQATFLFGRDGEESVDVHQYEGVMIPKGAYYAFSSWGEENLVMVRVGQARVQNDPTRRFDAAGNPDNKDFSPTKSGKVIPGQYSIDPV